MPIRKGCKISIKMFFKSKKVVPIKKDDNLNQDLAIITQMNQEFATSLDLNETLQTALEVIIKRINAQAANIFLIDEKKGLTLSAFKSVLISSSNCK